MAGAKRKLVKRTIGDVVRIELGDGTHTYARVLPEASFAIYDAQTTEDLPIMKTVERPVLFYVAVMNRAVKEERWSVVGHKTLEDWLQAPPRFIQDALNKKKFEIYQHGKIRPATRQECLGLERTAVWEPEHVEDRIRDFYAGRPNKWVELLKMRDVEGTGSIC
jgi:hypothetical protein